MKSFASLLSVAVFAFAGIASTVMVRPVMAADYVQARQPGWEEMCMRRDQPLNFCSSFSGPSKLRHTPDLEATLHSVSNSINAAYPFVSDRQNYGDSDYWTVPSRPGAGADCEDYVLAKIVALHQQGVSVSAMTILVGQLSNGRWHAILGVRTDAGVIQLDSLNGLGLGFRPAFYLNMNDTSSWRIA